MPLSNDRRARLSAIASTALTVFLSMGAVIGAHAQQPKASSTLNFSVRVLGYTGVQLRNAEPSQLAVNEHSRSMVLPLTTASTHDGTGTPTIQVLARFRDDAQRDIRGLSGRLDQGRFKPFSQQESAGAAVLVLANEPPTLGAPLKHDRRLELRWDTTSQELTRQVLEIEIRQY